LGIDNKLHNYLKITVHS